MVKKLIFSGIFSMMCTASFAASMTTLKQDNSMYVSQGQTYVGGSVGFPVTNTHGPYSGNVFAGYGKKFGHSQKIYLGGEANAGYSHFTGFHNWSGSAVSMGASFIPGYMLTPTLMAYGRVGLSTTHVSNGASTGTVVGAGLQKDINKNWALRGEFTTISNLSSSGQGTLGMVYKLD